MNKRLIAGIISLAILAGCSDDDDSHVQPAPPSNGPIDTPSDPIDTPSDPIDTPSDPIDTPSDPIDTPSEPIVPPTPVAIEMCTPILNIETNTSFECRIDLSTFESPTLDHTPDGLVIHMGSGVLRWSPMEHQVTSEEGLTLTLSDTTGMEFIFTLNVVLAELDKPGIYVSAQGDDVIGDGTPENPYQSLNKAKAHAKTENIPFQVYMRGGQYVDVNDGGSYLYFKMDETYINGTADNWLFIRSHGDEFASISAVDTVLTLTDIDYIEVEGLTLTGNAQSIKPEDVLDQWWYEHEREFKGIGIWNLGSSNVLIKNNVFAHFSGAATASNDGDFVTVEDNIIYGTTYWSTAGVHGVANSKPGDPDTLIPPGPGVENIIIRGNVAFSNASLIPSSDFLHKGLVHFLLDEGNGLHLQNNRYQLNGSSTVENNLVAYNGKSGVGLNTIDDVTIKNNSFYANARIPITTMMTTISGDISMLKSDYTHIDNNLIHSLGGVRAIWDFNNGMDDVTENIVNDIEVNRNSLSGTPVQLVENVFTAPANNDFTPAAGIDASFGVPVDVLERMQYKLFVHNVQITDIPYNIDYEYMEEATLHIFASWPAEADKCETVPANECDIPLDPDVNYDTVKIEAVAIDGERYEYTREQRFDFPCPPGSSPTEQKSLTCSS